MKADVRYRGRRTSRKVEDGRELFDPEEGIGGSVISAGRRALGVAH
jgi:hypothetical protein